MKKSFMVIGMGSFGRAVALELERNGVNVIVIDKNEEKVNKITDYVTMAVALDIRDDTKLLKLGIRDVDGMVIGITSDFDAAVITAIIGKEAQIPFIFAKAKDEMHRKVLKRIGVDVVMVPEQIAGIRLARSMAHENYRDYMEFFGNFQMIEITPQREWIGKSLKELMLRQKLKINVVAIRKDGELMLQFDPSIPLREGESLIVVKNL